jgi:integrase
MEVQMRDEGSSARSRRTKVKNRAGIYYRLDASGKRRYEFSYTDSSGQRRWKTIDGDLRDAEDARGEVMRRMRRGERVAPSRATLADVAAEWFAAQAQLRPRTREKYEGAIRVHINPRIGHVRISAVAEEHVLHVIGDMQAGGSAPWTIRGVLTPLGRILGYAVRRGLLASNPMQRLERGERPAVGRREQRVLERTEISAILLAANPKFRPLIATAIFSGLRLGELLGLAWRDIDFDAGYIRVRKQLDRDGQRVVPKTPQAVREVVMMPALGRVLREHRLRSPYSSDNDCVFASERGTPLNYRNVERRGLDAAAARAALNGPGRQKLRLHDARHTFASLMIAEGLDVVTVSRQLGHASPDITLKVYANLFDQARHAERTRTVMEKSFGDLLKTSAGSTSAPTGLSGSKLEAVE